MVRLTEKYRPLSWDGVVGQDKVVSALKKIANRGWSLPHMLFMGPPGCLHGDSEILVWNEHTGIIETKLLSKITEEFESRSKIPIVITLAQLNIPTTQLAFPVRSGKKMLYRLKTDRGDILASDDHIFYKVGPRGGVYETRVKKLIKGDQLLISEINAKNNGVHENEEVPRRCIKGRQEVLEGAPRSPKAGIGAKTTSLPRTSRDDRKNQQSIRRETKFNNKKTLGFSYSRTIQDPYEEYGAETDKTHENVNMPDLWRNSQNTCNSQILLPHMLFDKSFPSNWRLEPITQTRSEEETLRLHARQSSRLHPRKTCRALNENKTVVEENKKGPRILCYLHRKYESRPTKVLRQSITGRRRSTIHKESTGGGESLERAKTGQDGTHRINRVGVTRNLRNTLLIQFSTENEDRHQVSGLYTPPSLTKNYCRVGWDFSESSHTPERLGSRYSVPRNGVLRSEDQEHRSVRSGQSLSGDDTIYYKKPKPNISILLAIEQYEECESFDLIVPETNNFILENGLVVHNSGKTSVANVLGKVLDLPLLEYNASDDRGIEFIREEIKKQAQYKIEQIIFLDEADQLTSVAQHAMRRIMEKTTSAIFILAGNDEWKLIDAIKSRCSIFRFKRIPDNLVQQKIVEVIRAEDITINATTSEEREGVRNAIELLVKKAQGDLRTALNDLEQIIDEHQTITLESVAVIESSVGLYTLAMRQALAGKFEEAKTTIEKAYVEGHFDPRTSFQEIYDAIPGLTIDREVKIRLFAKLGEAEANSKRGSNPIIQIVSFISFVWLIPYLSACPVLSKSLGGAQ